MGENPAIRSGPCSLMVWAMDAAIISRTVSQLALRKPPLPRARCHRLRFFGSFTMDCHASTGSSNSNLASSHKSSSTPRIVGYFTLNGLYKYQEKEIPRWHPRGS